MKRFFHKRLPAMLLALVLMLGTVPLAAADEPCTHPEKTTETVAPTCTTAGSVKEICSFCHAVLSQREIPALGHQWVDEGVTAPATCGTATGACSR